MSPQARYDRIGQTYAAYRVADARWATQIAAAMGPARTVLNVGAGTGNYEPDDRCVIAIEPSIAMIAQRTGPAPVIQATAEQLPVRSQSFDVATALLTVHHWSDQDAGLRELARVSQRQVLSIFEPAVTYDYWLLDYFPDLRTSRMEREAPTARSIDRVLRVVDEQPMMVPADFADGVAAAYWRRPEAYLDPGVQSSMSLLAMLDPATRDRGIGQLRADLSSGAWSNRYGHLLESTETDQGYRLVIADGVR